jgi:hypothetical protein
VGGMIYRNRVGVGFSVSRALMRSSVLSSSFLLANVALLTPVQAACVDTANATQCANGSSAIDLIYAADNPTYVAGDFLLGLDNYTATSGISLTDVTGMSTVTLANGSSVTGGVMGTFALDGIYVKGLNGNAATVNVLDTSSVTGTDVGIQITTDSFSNSAGAMTVNAGTGSIVGLTSHGILVSSNFGPAVVNVEGEVTGASAGILVNSLSGAVSVTTGTGKVTGGTYWGISASSSGTTVVDVGGDVKGTQGLVVNGRQTIVTTAAGHDIVGTSGYGLIANGGSVEVNSFSRIAGESGGLYSSAGGNSVINTFDSIDGMSDSIVAELGYGIFASSRGFSAANSVSVTAHGDVLGGLDGIFALGEIYSSVNIEANANVTGNVGNGITGMSDGGDITITTGSASVVKGLGGDGIAASLNSVGLPLTGNIRIISNGDVSGGASGIRASGINVEAILGTATVETNGNVTGFAGDGVRAQSAAGDVSVTTAAGTLVEGQGIDKFGQGGFGISAFSGSFGPSKTISGKVTVVANSDVTGNSMGIAAVSLHNLVSVEANGAVIGKGNGLVSTIGAGAIAAGTQTGSVVVTTGANSVVDGQGPNLDGILAVVFSDSQNGTGTVNVTANGTVAGGQHGIEAKAELGSATVQANNTVIGTGGAGIVANTIMGDVSVTTGATAKVSGLGGDGIHAYTTTSGNVSVTALGETLGSVNGIEATTFGSASVTTGVGSVISQQGSGILVSSSGGANVVTGGDVTGGAGDGIIAYGGNGNVRVVTAAGHAVRGTGDGIRADSLSDLVTVLANGLVAGTSFGIRAEAANGSVNVVTGTEDVSGGWGIDAIGWKNVSVTSAGNVLGTEGGIRASGVLGDVSVSSAAGYLVSGEHGTGIDASTNTGTSTVVANGDVVGRNGYGIFAHTATGDVTVATASDSKVTGLNSAIFAYASTAGKVSVTALGDAFGKSGIVTYAADGVAEVVTGTGTITGSTYEGIFSEGTVQSTVTNNGIVKGLTEGVVTYSSGGNSINNNGLIENFSLAATDLAVRTELSAAIINNNAAGKILGRVQTGIGAFDDAFNNLGLWQTGGTSDFGAGVDQVLNGGAIKFASSAGAADATTFARLEALVNNGVISGQDQAVGDSNFDTLQIGGDYVGGAGSVLGLDAYLGGPGSLADVVTISGNASGSTAIALHNINPDVGVENNEGVLLVDVKGTASASNFYLANGPITQGLFVYDLTFTPSVGDNQYLLTSAPGTGANETVVAVDGVQGIWQGGTDAWSGHQSDLRDNQTGGVQITAVADPVIPENRSTNNMWARLRGNWTQRESQSSFTFLNAANNFNVGYNQGTYGVDGGIDFGVDAGADAKLLFGIVAGYATSNIDFNSSANAIDLEGGSLGAYASYVSNGVFADLLVKNDWLALDYKIPGIGNASTDGRALGASADVGYRFGSSKMFLEPMVSFSTTTTDIDSFVLGGGTIAPGTNTSTRIGAGARFGVTEETFMASITTRIWNGIGDGNAVHIGGTGLGITINDPGLSSGVSGEVSGNLAVNMSAASKLFVGGAVQFNADSTSESVNGGLTFNW